jgi:hypothetical protein
MAPKRGGFVYPPGTATGGKHGRYPINTIGRARSALARASSSKNRGSYQTVAKAVRAKYGNRVASVGRARGTTSRPGYRGGRR